MGQKGEPVSADAHHQNQKYEMQSHLAVLLVSSLLCDRSKELLADFHLLQGRRLEEFVVLALSKPLSRRQSSPAGCEMQSDIRQGE
jgi:hypothetical protein